MTPKILNHSLSVVTAAAAMALSIGSITNAPADHFDDIADSPRIRTQNQK
jgi:hypothetical protein